MKLFGWKSAGRNKARSARSLVQLTRPFGGQAMGQWPRIYENQLRDAYVDNPIAQRSVRLVTEAIATAPLNISGLIDVQGQSDETAVNKVLGLMQYSMAGQSLLETISVHLLLHGNAFIEILSDEYGNIDQLFALRPERVKIEADQHGWAMGYNYHVGGSSTYIPPDHIIHIRSINPLDDHYGMGCLGAASGAIAIHNAATKWNKALLDNAARPSGALIYEPEEGTPLSSEQYDRLKAELEVSFAGSNNAGRPMLLEGGLKWQALSMSPADMDFVGLKAAAAREIALSFGVPPMLLGLPGDATYANYREANKALWRQTILPLASKILNALSQGLQPQFSGLCMSINMDQVTALSEDRERLWAQVTGASFLSDNEKRAMLGLQPQEITEDIKEASDA